MHIEFNDDEMTMLQELFNTLDQEEVIFLSHYQLAERTGVAPDKWKQFLIHPAVSIWISQELQLFKEYQLKQMIKNATDNEKSVGAAQMINSLTKTLNEGQVKTGPIIVYTHVPLTEQQQEGTQVEYIELDEDVLALVPTDWRETNHEA